MGAFVISPLPPLLLELLQTAGLLRSTDVTPLRRYYEPLRDPLVFHRFPGCPVIRLPCSVDFATGRGGFLQLLSVSLPSCCRSHPAGVGRRFSQLRRSMLPSSSSCELGPRGNTFEATYAFTFVAARWLAIIPRMMPSIGFRDSVSLLPAIQATRRLTLASVGLPPTEYASLRWTHNWTCPFRTSSFPTGFTAAPTRAVPTTWCRATTPRISRFALRHSGIERSQ